MEQPIAGEPRGCVAIVAVMLGLFLFAGCVFSALDPGMGCGNQPFLPGDTCVTTTYGKDGAHTSSETLGSEAAYQHALHKRRVEAGVGMGVGAALVGLGLWLGGLSFRRRLPRAALGTAQHAEGRLTLTAAEAAAGGTRKVKVSTRVLCPRCEGRVWRDGKRCRRCGATGLGRTVRRTVTLRIPGGTRDGTVVRAKGGGTPGVTAVRPTGDLRVRVRVRGSRWRRTEASADAPTGGTVRSSNVVVTADAAGFRVRQCRRVGRWETELDLPWQRIRRLSFDTAPHDEVVSLYAWTTGSARHYACDARHLTRPEWRTLAAYVREASGGTVTLDLASRE